MIYDIQKLREQGIPAESLAEWGDVTTDGDICSAYRKMVRFYEKWGFDVFWAYKDQQWAARHGSVMTREQKETYIQNMLNNPPEGCSLDCRDSDPTIEGDSQ